MDNDHMQLLDDVCKRLQNAETEKEKELLKAEFWLLAIDAFNVHLAGDITTADGRVIHTPEIQL